MKAGCKPATKRDHAAQDYRTGRNFIKMYEHIGQNFDRKQIRSEKA